VVLNVWWLLFTAAKLDAACFTAAAVAACRFAELVAAAIAWFKLEQKPVNKADIKMLFDAFMERVAR
jgi:hypothetical protein